MPRLSPKTGARTWGTRGNHLGANAAAQESAYVQMASACSFGQCNYPGGGGPTGGPGYNIWVSCGGTLLDATCQPPTQAVPWSMSLSFNLLYPNLAPGDQPVGLDLWHCSGCGQTWRSAAGTVEDAAIAEGVGLAGGAALAEFGTSLFAEAAFNSATNSTEVGALNQWGVARYGWGWYQYGITFQPAATGVDAISGMYVLRLSILGLHFPYPF
jgi:hypothetical protein